MRFRIAKRDIVSFLGFFLIVLGNGVYIAGRFGESIEYIGLLLLFVLCLLPLSNMKRNQYFKILGIVAILSIGVFVFYNTNKTKFMIIATSVIIAVLSTASGNIISSNKKIKLVANAILAAAIVTIIIGFITGTAGIIIPGGIIGILFLAGFPIKNYCGGIWLVLFVLNYIFLKRENKINNRKSVYTLSVYLFLVILSGSKGALLLCVLFVLLVNYTKIMNLKGNQKKVFGFMFVIIMLLLATCVYNNILINVVTYAYRMRGFQNLLEYMMKDFKRLIFGISDIAYADNGYTYVYNIRNFLGWESSVEMAYVNVLIKNGLIGMLAYIIIYKNFFKRVKRIGNIDRDIAMALIILMLISGLVETYIVSIHYVVGPVMYCLLNGIIRQND